METMVRKQIYIRKRQEQMLKRQAKLRGVSEAEFLREALDRALTQKDALRFQGDPQAFAQFEKFITRKRKGASDKPYRWNREDAYQDRMRDLERRGKRG